MAKDRLVDIWLGRAGWSAETERTSDGWLVKVSNEGKVVTSFFPVNLRFKLPKGKNYLLDEVIMELISEPVANPGDGVVLKITAKQENIPALVGHEATIYYGIGVGEHSSHLKITLN